MWYAFDAVTGKAFHDRVKVLDRVEHPPLKPGQPVVVYPGSIGGLNYSPAAYDPKLNYIYNAAAETAGVLIQKKLTPTQKKRKFLLGDIFLGLDNGNFGDYLPGWKDHGSISAIDVSTGKRVWKFDTPEPERGGVSLTASGLGFAGGGDGVLRAFDSKTGKVLWTFQTGRQIAAGPTIFTVGRQGVRRDHGRRHADVLGRRPRLAAPGVRDRRQQGRVAEAAGSHVGAAAARRRPTTLKPASAPARLGHPGALGARAGSRRRRAHRRSRRGGHARAVESRTARTSCR